MTPKKEQDGQEKPTTLGALYAVTGAKKTKEEIAAQFAPDSVETEEEIVVPAPLAPRATPPTPVKPEILPVQQPQQRYSAELPGQPQTHDRRHKVPFEQRYRKENIQVDRRILPYFYDLIASGNSRVAVINQVLLKALLEAGYPIDPHILEKPFRYEDVPRE
jgi:hypothetical protein